MKTEELKIVNHSWASDNSYIDLTVKNTGTTTAIIEEVRVNNEPANNITYVSGSTSLKSGDSATIRVTQNFAFAERYEFYIVTQTGNRFFYLATKTSSKIPPGTETLKPNAAGTYQQWAPFGGTIHYSLTSDLSSTTGVQNLGSTTLLETENFADSRIGSGAINSVTAYIRAKTTSTETELTGAFVAYRDSTTGLNIPKSRSWSNAVWSAQSELASAGSPVRQVRSACCPKADRSEEKIVVTLSDDGYLDAYVWDGTAWIVTNNIGSAGASVNAYKCFDVVYEKTSGRALLVYSRGTTTNEIGYKIWTFGSGWGTEQFLDLVYTTGRVRWISLATASGARSGSVDDNEIALIYLDANTDVHGYVWTGSAWSLVGATSVWDATAAIASEECIAVAYEQTTGEAMFIWADSVSTDFYYKTWDGTTLSVNTLLDISAAGGVGNWVMLKADPSSDDLLFLSVDGGSDLNTAYWSGSGWTVHAEHDAGLDSNAQRCADFAWEPTGGKGLLVYGTTAGQITRKTFTTPNTWVGPTNAVMGANVHPWVQLRTNPRTVTGDGKILGAVLEGTVFDLGAIKWDGTTFTVIGTSTFSTDTSVITYESFDLEFEPFAPAEKAVILWRTYNLNYESAAFTISRTAFTDYSETRTTNLNTGLPWTWDEINALEIGSKASTLGADETIQVSEYWIIVSYAGISS
jgi:hypothetical protein